MNPQVKNLLSKIGIIDFKAYQGLKISDNYFHHKINKLFLEITLTQKISAQKYFYLRLALKKFLAQYAQYEIKYRLVPEIISLSYLNELIKYWMLHRYQNITFVKQMATIEIALVEQKYLFKCMEDKSYLYFKAYENDFATFLTALGIHNFAFQVIKIDSQRIVKTLQQKDQAFNQMAQAVQAQYLQTLKKEMTEESHFAKQNASKYTVYNLKAVHQAQALHIEVEGEVFSVEKREIKNGSLLIKFAITDYQEALECLYFLKEQANKETHPLFNLKNGNNLVLRGLLKDTQNGHKQLYVNAFKMLQKQDKTIHDQHLKPHLEMQFHTKMSTMDGLIDNQQLIIKAKQRGHKYLGISDTNNVQSFPEIYNLTKNETDLQIIYGAEISVISEKNGVFLNQQSDLSSLAFQDLNYVVFDLETTGLSPITDEIIEFAGALVVNGKVVAREQFFINPQQKLAKTISELTNISQADVDQGMPLEKALLKIQSFFANHLCVAHNALFDWQFLEEKFSRYNLALKNLFLDTLAIERLLDPKSRSHSLENLAYRAGYNYNPKVAHRAAYDTQILVQIFLSSWAKLLKLGINNWKALQNFTSDAFYSKIRAQNLTLYAKNQNGLKKLFETISLLNTKYFYDAPKFHLEKLFLSEDLVYLGGYAGSRLFETLLSKSRQRLAQEIAFYDVISISPLDSLKHYFLKYDKAKIITLLKVLIEEARKQKKLIISSATPRYLEKYEKAIHQICIEATGIKNARHHLFQYRVSNPQYPSQHYHLSEEIYQGLNFLAKELQEKIVHYNLLEFVSQFQKLTIIKDRLFTPRLAHSGQKLKNLVYHNAHRIYGPELPLIVAKRLDAELKPLLKSGYDVIYWISSQLVAKSLKDDFLVGSRGSVGSSLVATMAGITEVNPLPPHYYCSKCQYNEFIDFPESPSGYDLDDKHCPNCQALLEKEGQSIPFATFLGFEAEKVPDIDLNFSGLYQSQMHDFVKTIFGATKTFRSGTISTIAAKTAFGYVKAHYEAHQQKISNTFISFLSNKLVGIKRTTGQHPGGIIIVPEDYQIEDFTPINYPADDRQSDWLTTHFDFQALHNNLLKLDILGHDDPTALRYLERITNFKVSQIPKKDARIISIFSSPQALKINSEAIGQETTGALGIPEFGTSFVRKMLAEVKVQKFADLVSVSGLSHGTDVWLGNAAKLIKEEGKTLKEVISCRDDIMLTLMQQGVDAKLAFTIMEQVRKGQGLLKTQKKILKAAGVSQSYLKSMAKIKYLFPKAHATAYVIMAWRVAFYKVYFPLHFYSSYFTTRKERFSLETMIKGQKAINDLIYRLENEAHNKTLNAKDLEILDTLYLAREMHARGFKIANIDINQSSSHEWVVQEDQNLLLAPFNAIEGLGMTLAKKIVKARQAKAFSSVEDFKKRTNINNTLLKKLLAMRVFDALDLTEQDSLF